jgi:hypothetical protein
MRSGFIYAVEAKCKGKGLETAYTQNRVNDSNLLRIINIRNKSV